MIQTLDLTTRDAARSELAATRFGAGADAISEPTLWRWCRAAGVGVGQSTFHQHEICRLHQVAQMLTNGYNLSHVKTHFGV